VILGSLVYEKEFKLREIMKMMGLKIQVYWVVNYLVYLLFYHVAILLMVGIAAGMKFRYWAVNDFVPYFLLIFFWGNTMTATAFLFSAFFTKSRTATGIVTVYTI
jgi:hypothetical protein